MGKEREDNGDNVSVKDNVIFIGAKPFINYINSVVIQFTKKNEKEVVIKSRGKFISKAVDVAEVSSKKFLDNQNVSVKGISINSEEFQSPEGKKVNISTMDIVLQKK